MWTNCSSKQLEHFIAQNFEAHSTVHLALGCNTMVGVDVHGGAASMPWWYSGLPDGLHAILSEWAEDSSPPDIHHISLDASNPLNYFVELEDGRAWWTGPKSLTKALRAHADLAVDVVCFAPGHGWYDAACHAAMPEGAYLSSSWGAVGCCD